MSLPPLAPIRQIAFVVPDLDEAIARHARLFASGPYFVQRGVTMAGHRYRGMPWQLDMSVGFGQFGDVQIELIQLHDDRPSIFREALPVGARAARMHHICLHPASIDESIAGFAAAGCGIVLEHALSGGTRIVMIDTVADIGHFVELYQRTDEVAMLYDGVRNAAAGFDGHDLIRPMTDIVNFV